MTALGDWGKPLSRRVLLAWMLLWQLWVGPAWALDVPADPNASQRRYAVPVVAAVHPDLDSVTLTLLDAADMQPYEIRRRDHGEVAWSAVLASLPAGASTWTDESVVAGRAYEYQVRKALGAGEFAFGYVASGIGLDVTGERGVVLLVVDASLLDPLEAEIDRLIDDLTGDGWRVMQRTSPRGVAWDDPAGALALRQSIIDLWNATPSELRPDHLFLLGHLPVARSGIDGTAPDGHDENRGAHPTDAFYADIDGVWTDLSSSPPGVRDDHVNVPGDGRYDQDFLPSALEMAFGRVDFFEVEGQPGEDEVDILRRYLDRDHAYRHAQPGYRIEGDALFANGYVESVEMGWRSFPGIVGADRAHFVEFAEFDAVGGPAGYADAFGPFLLFAQNAQVPDLAAHRDIGTNALFWSSDQSYFGFWAQPFSHIRSLLATPGINLAWVWEVSPSYMFSDLGLGSTLGEAVRRTAEHSASNNLFERPARDYDEPGVWHRQFITLHGDPTIRAFVFEPPGVAVAQREGAAIRITWAPSPAAGVIGYHVDRAESRHGPYLRLTDTPIASDTLLDLAPPGGDPVYRIRAVRRETTGGGTLLNASQGSFAEALSVSMFVDGFEDTP